MRFEEYSTQYWTVLDSRSLLEAPPWLRVSIETVRLPDGRVIDDYHVIDQPDYVLVAAIDDRGYILTAWRYKHGPRCLNLGLPAGYLNNAESPLTAARRELREETGYEADYWRHLGSFVVDGNRGCGSAHCYLARDLRLVGDPMPDDLEDMRLEFMDPEELRRFLSRGDVVTLGAAVAVSLALANLSV